MTTSILLLKILIPTIISFVIGISVTPLFSRIFYKYKMWKRSSRIAEENTGSLEMAEAFKEIHNHKETHTPRVGGIIVWFSVCMTIILSSLFAYSYNNVDFSLSFISRNQTLIPMISLLLGAFLGLIDDFLQIFGNEKYLKIGIPRRIRIAFVLFVGAIEGIWFFNKLGYDSISLPILDVVIPLGAGFIVFYMLVVLALFSSSVIDGIDGLAAGVLSIIFTTYGFIGIIQSQYDIAIFSFVVTGALLAFLWFNIPPARFYLGETGILALTLSLSVLIFLTDTVFEFLIIGAPLVITAGSSLLQIFSRRFFNKKIFRVAPFHHHLELLGWSRAKITMRYWVFSVICSASGIVIVIIGNIS